MAFSTFAKKTTPFEVFLDQVGDATGNANANVSGSVGTPIDFKFVVPLKERWFVHALIVSVRDNAAFVANGYGAIAALTNGVQLLKKPSATTDEVNMTSQRSIICAGCWGLYTDDFFIKSAVTNDIMWGWTLHFPDPHEFTTGGSLIARIRDNLTGLTQHYFRVIGSKYKE